MANSFSFKSTVASGRQLVLDSTVPTSMTLSTLVFSSDMECEWEVYLDRDINTLRIPSLSFTDVNTGGTIPTDTEIYVRVTCVDANGIESPPSPSNAKKKTGAGNTHKIQVTWTAQTGAVSYRVYAGTKAGQETFVTEVLTNSAEILTTPPNQYLSIPTNPDIHLVLQKGGLSVPAEGIPLNQRIVVFATPAAGGVLAMSCIAM